MAQKLPKKVSEETMSQAWNQQFAEDWLIEMNMITPEYLNKVRLLLMVVFNLKKVDVNCDMNEYKMDFEIKFDFWKNLFKSKKKAIKAIANRLSERFPAYNINVRVAK